MAFRVGLHNFSKGVLSDEVQGRIDVAAYNSALKRGENCYILKEGGIRGRPGTRVVYETATNDVRLLPFEVAADQTYMMLFEQASMKPLNMGGVVLEAELAITGITNAVNARVTIAFHGYVAGREVFFTEQDGMTEINGRTATIVSVIDANNFTIDLDTTSFGVWAANTGGTTNVGPPTPVTPPVVPPPATPPTVPPTTPTTGGGTGSGTVFGGNAGGTSTGLHDIDESSL